MSILLEFCNDLHVLQEAYYGKPKEFIEIEKRLEKIIEMIRLQKETPSLAVNINSMKELEEIEAIFTKFFKNYKTSITFYAPISYKYNYNAYTVPSSLSYFRKDPNNKRIARAEDLFINVNVDIGLVYGLDMTAQELMACILHEIGHCFDASLFMLLTNVCIMPRTKEISNAFIGTAFATFIRAIQSSKPVAHLYQEFNRIVSQNPTLNKIFSDINMILTDALITLGQFSMLMNGLKVGINLQSYIFKLIQPSNMFGYAAEKFADSFATSYGYGKDIASMMHKVERRKGFIIQDTVSKIPILNIGYDFTKVYLTALCSLTDPHPNTATRIQSQLNKLKRDLNDPKLDPKVKREMMDNIHDLEQYINDVVLNPDHADNYGKWVTMYSNYAIIKVFNGKIDPRELFEIVWNHEM